MAVGLLPATPAHRPLAVFHSPHDPGEFAALITGDSVGDPADDSLEVGEGVLDLRPIARDDEFADALVVPGSTHFEYIESPGHLTTDFNVLQEENCIRNR